MQHSAATVRAVVVLRSRDGVWRAERRRTGWDVYELGGLVLHGASLDRMVAYLLERGVDPQALVQD